MTNCFIVLGTFAQLTKTPRPQWATGKVRENLTTKMSRWITVEVAELAVKALEDKNSRLKDEIEKLKIKLDGERHIFRHDWDELRLEKDKVQRSLEKAEAQVERLTKAGDDMSVWITIIGNSSTCWQIEEWLRAKKGLLSEKEQREKQIKTAKDGNDPQ